MPAPRIRGWCATGCAILSMLAACSTHRQAPERSAPERPATPAAAGTLNVSPPRLSTGDKWVYRYQHAAGNGTGTQEIRGRETFGGIDCYVLGLGQTRQVLLRATDMAVVEEREGGSPVIRFTPPLEELNWPLHTGLTWRQKTTVERVRDEATHDLSGECRVHGEEDVSVPAGTFRTLRITCRNQGGAVIESWYAPAVRNFVRMRRPRRGSVEVRELIEFRLAP